MKARILWVEGKRADNPSFVSSLKKKEYLVEIVPTGNAAVGCLVEFDPDLIVINAASFRSSGKRICNEIREKSARLPIVLILSPEHTITGTTSANVVLELPFTSRKLLNRIAPLLPGDGKNILHVGFIRLDLERKRVRCLGREARLTPRLTHLLQMLLLHAGEAVEDVAEEPAPCTSETPAVVMVCVGVHMTGVAFRKALPGSCRQGTPSAPARELDGKGS